LPRRLGHLEICEDTREFQVAGRRIPLEPKPFSVLLELLRAHPDPVPRADLITRVWPDVTVTQASLDRAVSAVRSALGASGPDGPRIRTLRGVGYALEGVSSEARPPSDLVGRQQTLELLSTSIPSAGTRDGSVVLIAGEPGIGKTHLVERVAASADPPTLVALGRANQNASQPYWEWRNPLRACIAALEPGSLAEVVRGREPALLAVEPNLGLAQAAPQSRREVGSDAVELWHDVGAFFEAVSQLRPLLLILEDLHWAGRESLGMLEHLAREFLPLARMLIVATYRAPGAPDNPHIESAVAHLVSLPQTRAVEHLRPFDTDQVREFLSRETRLVNRDGLAEELRRWTGGNPLFVREVARLLETNPSRRPIDTVPSSVEALVGERVLQLPPITRELLEAAALLEPDASSSLVASICDLDEKEAWISLAPAEHAGLINLAAPGRIRFSHDLVREAIQSRLARARAAELHLAAADAIEEQHKAWLDPCVGQLSYHLYESQPLCEPERLVRHAVAAGRQARLRSAYSEAAVHFTRALEASNARGEAEAVSHCKLLLSRVGALLLAGDGVEAARSIGEAIQLARRLQNGILFARAALARGAWAVQVLSDPETIKLLEEAIDLLPSDEHALRLRALSQLALQHEFAGQRETATRLLAAVAEQTEQLDDPGLNAMLLCTRVIALQHQAGREPPLERLQQVAAAITAAEAAGETGLALRIRRQRISLFDELGDAERLDAEIDYFERAPTKAAYRSRRYYAAAFRAGRLLARAEFTRAREKIAEALRWADPLDPSETLFTPTTQRVLLPMPDDELEQLLADIKNIQARFPSLPSWEVAPLLPLLELDRRDQLERCVEEALRRGVETLLLDDMADLTVIATLALGCHEIGDRRHAAELYDRLAPYAGRNVDVGWGIACWGPVDHFRGLAASLLGRREVALSHFASAAEMNERMGLRHWAIRNTVARAQLLSTSDETLGLARRLGQDARGIAEHLGLRRETRALAEIAAGRRRRVHRP